MITCHSCGKDMGDAEDCDGCCDTNCCLFTCPDCRRKTGKEIMNSLRGKVL